MACERQRVERIWRREGLKVPKKQPKRGRLWLTDGSCIRLRPQHRNHVWSYDFVEDRTHDGRKYRMLNVLDEFTHESLAIRVARKLKAIDVIDVLSDLFILRGVPGHIRSDNGSEFVAKAVRGGIQSGKRDFCGRALAPTAIPSAAGEAFGRPRFACLRRDVTCPAFGGASLAQNGLPPRKSPFVEAPPGPA